MNKKITNIRLDVDLEERISLLSKVTERSKTFYISKAIEMALDDLEDIYLSEESLQEYKANTTESYSLSDLQKEYDINALPQSNNNKAS